MPAQPTPPRISGYDFIQPLGTGATASVYRYHQRVPSRDVAIKVSSATLDPRAAARFRNEANYMAELSAHPYILSIHDAGVTSTGLGYIVLEYAPGGSYKELIDPLVDWLADGRRVSGRVAVAASADDTVARKQPQRVRGRRSGADDLLVRRGEQL